MIAASRNIALVALGIALLVHAALALVLVDTSETQIEGGAGAPETRLGTSFADMAAGTLTAARATEPAEALPPAEVTPRAALTPAPQAALQPQRGEPVAAEPAPSPEVMPHTVEMPAPDVPAPAKAVRPAKEASHAVAKSLRPKLRTPEFEAANARARAAPQAKPKPELQQQAQPAPRGNAEQNAAKGTASGMERAKAATSGAGAQKPQAAGNAAASNYPGVVMAKISRVARPRSTSRGTAVVNFSVAAGGGLAGLDIASSSGSSQLDNAALQMIRRAAPFPAPPPGAQRSFTISIKGR
ncbi:TonB family protein [Roseovarius sp. S4756]|uniref:TonB family protein n=1 Tax=Roseovarius maritimus TaxID=3342637 RepID=UPI00372B950E